jgi:hypothetical protein
MEIPTYLLGEGLFCLGVSAFCIETTRSVKTHRRRLFQFFFERESAMFERGYFRGGRHFDTPGAHDKNTHVWQAKK